MIVRMRGGTIVVILVVWFLMPRVARLMIHTPTALSIFVFFSRRRRHTRLQGDWSSDVCSSDLAGTVLRFGPRDSVRQDHNTVPAAAQGVGTAWSALLAGGARAHDLSQAGDRDEVGAESGVADGVGGALLLRAGPAGCGGAAPRATGCPPAGPGRPPPP